MRIGGASRRQNWQSNAKSYLLADHKNFFVYCLAVVLLAVSPAIPVSAHEAHSGMKYDQECCHDNDCAPAIESHQEGMDLVITTIHGTMRVTPGMTWVKRLPSTDGKLHGCQYPTTHIPICIYLPVSG
jgi:hypothetical protein